MKTDGHDAISSLRLVLKTRNGHLHGSDENSDPSKFAFFKKEIGLSYFTKWPNFAKRNEMKSVLCEMKICTLRNETCTMRNEILYFAKWNLYFAKWKSVLCKMKICTLRNEMSTLLYSTLLYSPCSNYVKAPNLFTTWYKKFDFAGKLQYHSRMHSCVEKDENEDSRV